MPRYELLLKREFSAAHRIRLYDGEYEPLHGHNWEVEVHLEAGGLDRIGVAADFVELQRRLGGIIAELHDRYLNELPAFAEEDPTTERVARYIFQRYAPELPPGLRLARVRVWETGGCAAAYLGD